MNRAEYMAKLRYLLADITEAEREEALNYYEDYFDDAGVENEASVIESLGSPERVAATIKDGLNDANTTGGEFSETGYSNYTYDKDEIASADLNNEGEGTGKKKDLSAGMLVVIIILCVFALPILGPIVIAILSVLFSLLCTVAALLFSVIVAGVAVAIAGIALIISGIATMIQSPVVGILLAGVGLILIGLGVLIGILGIWILTKVVPPMLRGLVNFCRKPFERKRG